MFDVGFGELFFLGVIVIIVLGPDRLPDAIRFSLKTFRKFSQIKSDIKQKIDLELELHQLRDELKGEIQNVKQLESQMQGYLANLEQNIEQNPELNIQQDLDQNSKKYYPIQSFSLPTPFKTQFVLSHLMHWSCLNLDSVGVRYV